MLLGAAKALPGNFAAQVNGRIFVPRPVLEFALKTPLVLFEVPFRPGIVDRQDTVAIYAGHRAPGPIGHEGAQGARVELNVIFRGKAQDPQVCADFLSQAFMLDQLLHRVVGRACGINHLKAVRTGQTVQGVLQLDRQSFLICETAAEDVGISKKGDAEGFRFWREFRTSQTNRIGAHRYDKIRTLLGALEVGSSNVLFLTTYHDKNVYKSGRNIPRFSVVEARQVSTLDVLNAQTLIVQEGALELLNNSLGLDSQNNKTGAEAAE